MNLCLGLYESVTWISGDGYRSLWSALELFVLSCVVWSIIAIICKCFPFIDSIDIHKKYGVWVRPYKIKNKFKVIKENLIKSYKQKTLAVRIGVTTLLSFTTSVFPLMYCNDYKLFKGKLYYADIIDFLSIPQGRLDFVCLFVPAFIFWFVLFLLIVSFGEDK